MANMMDYISWRGDIPFTHSPFNPVDNIIFSQFSYLPLDGIVPGPGEKGTVSIAAACEQFEKERLIDPSFRREEETIKNAGGFFRALGASRRYGQCRLCGYANETCYSQEKQFSALCIITSGNILGCTVLLVYRGTDTSLAGWKEDLNMSCLSAVPAQLEAVSYLGKMARRLRGSIILAGHSKGGNLAVYAASHCGTKISRRISAIYSNDAPGFHRTVIESKGYRAIQGRIQSFVPQSSFVGMLFEHGVNNTVVKSTENGIRQHDLYSWEVTPNSLAAAEGLSDESRMVDKIIREWLDHFDNEQRQRFIEAVYMPIAATQAQSVTELTSNWFKTARSIIQSLKNIDGQDRRLIIKTFTALFSSIKKHYTLRTRNPLLFESGSPGD